MSTKSTLPSVESGPRKSTVVWPWFVTAVLCLAALFAWLAWPTEPEGIPYDLSRADGRSRFYVTTFPKAERPANLTLLQRLEWEWVQHRQRYGKRRLAAFSFPARPAQLCGIQGLLNQCMDVSGTQYLIAVETLAGMVKFGNTNVLNGSQWVAAFEHTIETSGPVECYDFAQKRTFQDTLLLIREKPGLVKVVPRSKLAEYQQAGLVKAGPR